MKTNKFFYKNFHSERNYLLRFSYICIEHTCVSSHKTERKSESHADMQRVQLALLYIEYVITLLISCAANRQHPEH